MCWSMLGEKQERNSVGAEQNTRVVGSVKMVRGSGGSDKH